MICDDEGRKLVDLGLIERKECLRELEAEVDKNPARRLFWFGLGLLAGGLTAGAMK